MNKTLINLFLMLCLPLTALAVESGNNEGKHHGLRLERLSKELGITDEQKAKVKALYRANKGKIKEIKEANQDKIKESLTQEQKIKLEKLRQQRSEARKLKNKVKDMNIQDKQEAQ